MQFYLAIKNKRVLSWIKAFAFCLFVIVALWIGMYFIEKRASDFMAILAVVTAMLIANFIDFARTGKIIFPAVHVACIGAIFGSAIVMYEKDNSLAGLFALTVGNAALLLGAIPYYREKDYRKKVLKDFRVKDLAMWSLWSFVVMTVISLNAIGILSKEGQYAILAAVIVLVIATRVIPLLRVGRKYEFKNYADIDS